MINTAELGCRDVLIWSTALNKQYEREIRQDEMDHLGYIGDPFEKFSF